MGKETDLIEAGRNGDVATIEKLLACRKPRKISGFAPLGFTFSSLRRAVNANAQNSQGDTSLHLAALNGHLEAVQTLLKYDASANLMDASGCFPLHLASWSGNGDICRTLLNQGPSLAKVNEQNAAGDTALHTAAQYGHAQTVRVLLENFADPLIRNQSAETALDLAAQYGRLDCVRLLLNSCPALADCSTKYSSALNLAARNGHKDVILALLNSGLDVNSVSGYGTSALHEAARSGKADTVALLLTHGADLTIRDGKGRTALDLVQDIPSDAAREIVRLIRLKEETKFASYPRPSLLTNGTDACTNSLKFIRRPPPNKNSFSSEYAASVHSSDYSSLVDSSDGSYSPSSYSRTERDTDLQTFRIRRDPNGNTKSLNTSAKEEEESDYCEVQGQLEIEELDGSPRRARFRIKEEQREARKDVYATVNKERATCCNTLPKVGTQIVYNEDLYEAFDPDWSARSRDSEDQSETVTDSALDQSEATNGSADMTDSPDVEMPESDVPPIPPKMPCIRNNNPEYLDMNGSSRKEPILTIVETSDDEYVDVEPFDVIGESDVTSGAMRETDIVNGCSSTDDNLGEDEIVPEPVSPSQRDRPPSLELASTRPQSTPDDVTSRRCDVTDQLPTPDHPPPSPKTALRGIQMVINPKDKRRSRDMETSTDEIQFPAKPEQSSVSDTPPAALPTTPESESESESDSESGVVAVRTSIHEPFKAVPEETEESLIKGSTPGKRRAMSAMYEDMVVRSPVKRSSLNITVGANQQEELNSMFKEIDDIVSDLKCHKDPRNRRSGSSQDRVLIRGGDDVTMRQSDVTNGSAAGGGASEEKTRDDSHSEDWAEIADIMASFGGRITRESVFIRDFEEEFTRLITGSSRAQSVGDWLASLSLSQYENILVPNGFDDMDYMAPNVLEEADLIEMGIYNELHRDTLLSSLKQLPPMKTIETLTSSQLSVEDWLRTLHLEAYLPVFVQHDYTTLDKVRRIWELELTTVLDITTLGHRKRIIASLGLSRPQHRLDNMEKVDLSTLSWTLGSEDSGVTFDMNHLTVNDDVTTDAHDVRSHSSSDVTSDLSSDVGTTSSTTSTTSTSSDKPKMTSEMTVKPVVDIIEPECSQRTEASLDVRRRTRKTSSEQSDEEDVMVVRRRPRSQQVNRMSYSGLELRPPQDTVQEENTGVQAWKHRPEELIKGCCYYFAQYLGSTFIRELNEESTHESIVKLKNQHDNVSKLPLITLAISYRGVKFIEARSKKVICEHEIGNIFCVRQDDEHRNFLAYITEDLTSSKHYCHVFSVKTAELAAEITLTLGEAFEVAYQVALREKSVEAEREYEDLLLQTEAQIDYALSHH